jgi:hypothetical protein
VTGITTILKKLLLYFLLAIPFASLFLTAFADVSIWLVLGAMFVFEPLMVALITRLEGILGVRVLPTIDEEDGNHSGGSTI